MYLCKSCNKYFSVKVDYSQDVNPRFLLNDHLDGISFRKLSIKYSLSKSSIQRIVFSELRKLPNNNKYTHKTCNKFSEILVVDAKYVNVKGYEKGCAFIWGVDYLRHDFPVILLALSESYEAWSTYFFLFRILSHHYKLVISDQHKSIELAIRHKFPNSKHQWCYNHYKENIRRNLLVRSEDKYKPFMESIKTLFLLKRTDEDFNTRLFKIFNLYKDDPIALSVVIQIEKDLDKLRAFKGISNAPVTTNIIESFNSHLESRLKSIHKFESFKHAELWLNGYILKRRHTKFTSCKGKFTPFNGKSPIDFTKKKDAVLCAYFD